MLLVTVKISKLNMDILKTIAFLHGYLNDVKRGVYKYVCKRQDIRLSF